MEIVTKGQFDCFTEIVNGVTVGWCFAYSSCKSFDNLWSFAFQATFSGQSNQNYVNIPLSTFAYDLIYDYDGTSDQFCAIFVENLDPAQPLGGDIIIGSMFFQSFVGVFTVSPNVSTTITNMQLFAQPSKTNYVLPGVYIGNATTNPTTINPFAINPVTP